MGQRIHLLYKFLSLTVFPLHRSFNRPKEFIHIRAKLGISIGPVSIVCFSGTFNCILNILHKIFKTVFMKELLPMTHNPAKDSHLNSFCHLKHPYPGPELYYLIVRYLLSGVNSTEKQMINSFCLLKKIRIFLKMRGHVIKIL